MTLQQHPAHTGKPHAQHVRARSLTESSKCQEKEGGMLLWRPAEIGYRNQLASKEKSSKDQSEDDFYLLKHRSSLQRQTITQPPCNIISIKNSQRNWLTNELLVPNVQSHVPQSCGHGTNHPVIVYPQQLHQDRKTLLFTNCSAYIDGPLDRAEVCVNYFFLISGAFWIIIDDPGLLLMCDGFVWRLVS